MHTPVRCRGDLQVARSALWPARPKARPTPDSFAADVGPRAGVVAAQNDSLAHHDCATSVATLASRVCLAFSRVAGCPLARTVVCPAPDSFAADVGPRAGVVAAQNDSLAHHDCATSVATLASRVCLAFSR